MTQVEAFHNVYDHLRYYYGGVLPPSYYWFYGQRWPLRHWYNSPIIVADVPEKEHTKNKNNSAVSIVFIIILILACLAIYNNCK